MANTGWDRSLGTSKREQGIVTPPHPKFHKCGCVFLSRKLQTLCVAHELEVRLALKQMKEQEVTPPEVKPEPEKPTTPWVENVKAGENVSVQIS